MKSIPPALHPISLFPKIINADNAGSMSLFAGLIAAMVMVNSPLAAFYHHLWEIKFGLTIHTFSFQKSLHEWINDGLMAIFFFSVGLELKKEFIAGELANPRKAILPIVGAFGGMIIPAIIYFFFNHHLISEAGWGIPMATDIAFALGLLALVKSKVPPALKIFLTALAIADDLGAIVVIAFFYSHNLSLLPLILGIGGGAILLAANILGVRNLFFYTILGICCVWFPFLISGVHATVAGVIIAFTIPARTRINEEEYVANINKLNRAFEKEIPERSSLLTNAQHLILKKIKSTTAAAETPLQKMEYVLHPWVTYLIMPLFAFANAGITFRADIFNNFWNPLTTGIMMGLIVGKFLGVVGFSRIMVAFKLGALPSHTNWKQMCGIGLFAGIGFTMSLFVSNLAFSNQALIEKAKYGILGASTIAAITGIVAFKFFIKASVIDLNPDIDLKTESNSH